MPFIANTLQLCERAKTVVGEPVSADQMDPTEVPRVD